ncbi:MAG: hypothetical protein KKF41_04510 [Actinobacteria bacterium]|nr:hypothetical protein [Actinomycetota bacterium]MBU1943473.1 hypothetical protein [Actinomycetota bacterium]MBU2686830.1 hypothetical protein [Actinomycetota bacterium]
MPLAILVPTIIMLAGAHYPGTIFMGIAVPVYLALVSMVFAGSRRFGLRLEMSPWGATLVAATGYVTLGAFPLVYLLAVDRRNARRPPPPTPLDCRMPVIIDGVTYREAGGLPDGSPPTVQGDRTDA